MSSDPVVARVAVPRPFLGTLAYAVPGTLADRIEPGMRVRVPLGRGVSIGVVDAVERDGGPPEAGRPARLKPLSAVLDDTPVLDPSVLDVCRWIADYYVAPLGVVLKTALPPGLLGSNPEEQPAPRTRRVIRIVDSLPTLSARDAQFGRARRQREAFDTLESLGGEAASAHMTSQLGFSSQILRGLVDKGVAVFADEEVDRDPFSDLSTDGVQRHRPTPDQRRVIDALLAASRAQTPGVTLLRGVTGSGKTLVYLEVLEQVLGEGKSAIVLVPEISLTPQTVQRFRSRFGDGVAVLHSGLSDGERFDAWRALASGARRVAIGARSAVFAPVQRLGAIILDEEHEGSYKQSDTPRYHARSVAVVRARAANALCILGSATPSLESWHNAARGVYRLLELPERVSGNPLPPVRLIDLRGELSPADSAGRERTQREGEPPNLGPTVFSAELRQAIAARLDQDEQVILLLNRRGYSTFIQCDGCGHVWACTSCSVSLTHHRRRGRLVCHHCGFERSVPESCKSCGLPEPSFSGVGTEQVERRLGELFPAARVERMDLDTTGSKWSHFGILERVGRREVDILLGTQMIAKGLDFPGVTLVGAVNADVGLNLPDFRASERTFQLLEQVAGRAGRGDRPGEVLVQTVRPLHYALQAAAAHDFVGFAAEELAFREEPGYPPFQRLANVVVSGTDEDGVARASEDLAEWTRGVIDHHDLEGLRVVGPAPCPIDRLRGRWRWHFLLKSERPGPLGSVLRYLADQRGRTDRRLRVEIDRDPEALL